MANLLEFNSGSKVVLIDGKMFLTYGRKNGGEFVVSFDDIASNLFTDKNDFISKVTESNDCITVYRVKDYDGEFLVPIEKISESRRAINIYFKVFDSYESKIIKAIAKSLLSE